MRRAALAGAALLALCAGASAQEPEAPSAEAVKAAVGRWELSNAERDRTCTVTLRTPAGTGAGVPAWERQCAELFVFTRQATAWRIAGRDAIRFTDAGGNALVEFTEVESGMYEGRRPGEGLLFLQNVTNGVGQERQAEQLLGDWNFVRGSGRPLCQVTLLAAAAGPEFLSLRLKPGCDAQVARFSPTAWRLDRGELVLVSAKEESWRFEEAEPMVWRRIPEGRQPLQLVRP